MLHLDHLPNKRPGEHVAIFLRRHWLTAMRIVVLLVLLLGIPALALAIFWPMLQGIISHPVWGPLLVLAGSMYTLCVWLLAFVEYTDYYLDTWIVTNERILNTEQNGLFHRIASELHLAQIQDVTAETRGMLHTFLDYGDVHVQTAAEHVRFQFKNVEHPERVKQKILHLMHEDQRRKH